MKFFNKKSLTYILLLFITFQIVKTQNNSQDNPFCRGLLIGNIIGLTWPLSCTLLLSETRAIITLDGITLKCEHGTKYGIGLSTGFITGAVTTTYLLYLSYLKLKNLNVVTDLN